MDVKALGIRVNSKMFWAEQNDFKLPNKFCIKLHLERDFPYGFEGILIEGEWIEIDEQDTLTVLDSFLLKTKKPMPCQLLSGSDVDVTIFFKENGASQISVFLPLADWDSNCSLSGIKALPLVQQPVSKVKKIDRLPPALRALVDYYTDL